VILRFGGKNLGFRVEIKVFVGPKEGKMEKYNASPNFKWSPCWVFLKNKNKRACHLKAGVICSSFRD